MGSADMNGWFGCNFYAVILPETEDTAKSVFILGRRRKKTHCVVDKRTVRREKHKRREE